MCTFDQAASPYLKWSAPSEISPSLSSACHLGSGGSSQPGKKEQVWVGLPAINSDQQVLSLRSSLSEHVGKEFLVPSANVFESATCQDNTPAVASNLKHFQG
jgi:hypothetical protein